MSEWTKERIEEIKNHLPIDIIRPDVTLSALNEITRLQSALEAAREDAERLSEKWREYSDRFPACIHCGYEQYGGSERHAPDCPIALHRELTGNEDEAPHDETRNRIIGECIAEIKRTEFIGAAALGKEISLSVLEMLKGKEGEG